MAGAWGCDWLAAQFRIRGRIRQITPFHTRRRNPFLDIPSRHHDMNPVFSVMLLFAMVCGRLEALHDCNPIAEVGMLAVATPPLLGVGDDYDSIMPDGTFEGVPR
jgi:hypothetical protein